METRGTQILVIELMKKLGYQSNAGGVCYGIACMGIQALLCHDLDYFNERLNFIATTPADEIVQLINKERFMVAMNQTRLLPERLERQKMILSIPAFLEGVEMYFAPRRYPDWFPTENRPFNQDIEQTSKVLLPEQLKEKGGLVNIDKGQFLGAYDFKELVAYCKSLREAGLQSSSNEPITIRLASCNHAISIAYDRSKDKFIIINAKQGEYIDNNEKMAEAIKSAFKTTIFSTAIYTTKDNQEDFEKVVSAWKNSSEWQSIHKISLERATLIDQFGGTALFVASAQGDLQIVEDLIKNGANVNQALKNDPKAEKPIYQGATPLTIAVQNGHTEVAKLLITNGADVNHIINKTGATPLILAAQTGRIELAEFLIANGANINYVSRDGNNPIIRAAANGHLEMVKLLIANGADINYVSPIDENPITLAAKNGHLEIVKYMAEQFGENLYLPIERRGKTLFDMSLQLATAGGHTEIVKYLEDQRMEYEKQRAVYENANYYYAPLITALQQKDLATIKSYIEQGVDANQVLDTSGYTVLSTAAYYGHLDVVKYLVEQGANIYTPDESGWTPLDIALQTASDQGHHDLSNYLEELRANVQSSVSSQTFADSSTANPSAALSSDSKQIPTKTEQNIEEEERPSIKRGM